MIIVTDKNAQVLVNRNTLKARKRVGGNAHRGRPTVPVMASRLLISGPSMGTINAASDEFTVSTDGPLQSPVVVHLRAVGITGVFSNASLLLTPDAPSATFTFTPTQTGTATITITNVQVLESDAYAFGADHTTNWTVHAGAAGSVAAEGGGSILVTAGTDNTKLANTFVLWAKTKAAGANYTCSFDYTWLDGFDSDPGETTPGGIYTQVIFDYVGVAAAANPNSWTTGVWQGSNNEASPPNTDEMLSLNGLGTRASFNTQNANNPPAADQARLRRYDGTTARPFIDPEIGFVIEKSKTYRIYFGLVGTKARLAAVHSETGAVQIAEWTSPYIGGGHYFGLRFGSGRKARVAAFQACSWLEEGAMLANPGGADYVSQAVSDPGAVDVSNKWLYWNNPAQEWEQPADQVPPGIKYGSGGKDNKLRLVIEGYVRSLELYDTFKPNGTYSNMTVDELRRGDSTPTYPILSRVDAPGIVGRKAFRYALNKTEVSYLANPSYKMRSETTITGNDRYSPFGVEEWVVLGSRFPNAYLLSSNPGGGFYNIFFQFHDASGGLGGLTGNPPVALYIVGGNGNAANAKFTWTVRRYKGTGWPNNPTPGNNVITSGTLVNSPEADTWHWFAIHTKSGCGYQHPTKGAIYGAMSPSQAWVKVYYAKGNGTPSLVGQHSGYWGSPYKPNDSRTPTSGPFPLVGYWKSGMYSKNDFLPGAAGDDRIHHNLGVKCYRPEDAPGMSVYDVLRDYRGS